MFKRIAVRFREAKKLPETNREFLQVKPGKHSPPKRNDHLPTIPCSGVNSLLVSGTLTESNKNTMMSLLSFVDGSSW